MQFLVAEILIKGSYDVKICQIDRGHRQWRV